MGWIAAALAMLRAPRAADIAVGALWVIAAGLLLAGARGVSGRVRRDTQIRRGYLILMAAFAVNLVVWIAWTPWPTATQQGITFVLISSFPLPLWSLGRPSSAPIMVPDRTTSGASG